MREIFKKRFLVVGGRGFIGRALVRRLLEGISVPLRAVHGDYNFCNLQFGKD